MPIRMPMDEELYEAAVAVTEQIEEKLAENRHMTPEAVLGHRLADAYQHWQTVLISKYTASDEPEPVDVPLVDTPPSSAKPARFDSGSHPWRRARAVVPKRT
jgi:hypothetical protein